MPFTERTLDVPLSLKTITDVFTYEAEEVDVRMLYQTLTNLSLGFPTSQLDNASNDFLYGVYKASIFHDNCQICTVTLIYRFYRNFLSK